MFPRREEEEETGNQKHSFNAWSFFYIFESICLQRGFGLLWGSIIAAMFVLFFLSFLDFILAAAVLFFFSFVLI